jgi:hypothetical protein
LVAAANTQRQPDFRYVSHSKSRSSTNTREWNVNPQINGPDREIVFKPLKLHQWEMFLGYSLIVVREEEKYPYA